MSATWQWAKANPDAAARLIRELERENADLHDTLDAVIEADERAVDLWRAAHPGKELVIPDRARLVGWLMEQNASLRADKDRLDFLSTLTGSGWACLHLDQKGENDDWFLTRKQIDLRMATEPKQ